MLVDLKIKKRQQGLRWYPGWISGLVVLTVSRLICWLKGSALWDNLPCVPSKCGMSEAYLIKWADKALTSAREWVKCRQVWETNGFFSLCWSVQRLLRVKWPSGRASVSRVTWVFPSSRLTCCYHWKELSPLSPYFSASLLLLRCLKHIILCFSNHLFALVSPLITQDGPRTRSHHIESTR